MKRLRSPVFWFGGKGNMVHKLVPILEAIPHTRYTEPFGGGASVLLAKRPVDLETYNDLDNALYDLFRVLADPDLFEQFYRRVCVLPYHRRLYNEYRATWRDEPDLIKRVAMWWYIARTSFGGRFEKSFGTVVTTSRRRMASTASKLLSAVDMLPDIADRLRRVQIENAPFQDIFRRYDTPDTLFYVDPPYVPDTRKDGGYAHELTLEDHEELVQILLSVEGKAALSGYDHPVYAPLLDAGWTVRRYVTASHAAARTRATGIQGSGTALKTQGRVECLWLSPNTQRGQVEQERLL